LGAFYTQQSIFKDKIQAFYIKNLSFLNLRERESQML